jgi:hypothetical protein
MTWSAASAPVSEVARSSTIFCSRLERELELSASRVDQPATGNGAL